MNIRFSGITHYTAPKHKQLAMLNEIHSIQAGKPRLAMTAAFKKLQGVVLDGTDMDKFLKDKYNLVVPPELKNKSEAELLDEEWKILEKTLPAKQRPAAKKIREIYSNFDQYSSNVFEYFYDTALRNDGHDAEGKPIIEKQL